MRKKQTADTVLDLGVFRCIQPHCENCSVEIRSMNGREINDPKAEIQIIAHLKVRDFTVDSWRDKGKNAKRHNMRVIVDLENAQLLHAGKPLQLSNLDEILAGIREVLGGAAREQELLRPERSDSSGLLGGL
jgi:hypothetical protein